MTKANVACVQLSITFDFECLNEPRRMQSGGGIAGSASHASDVPSTINCEAHTPQEIQVARHSRKQAFEYLKKSQCGRALAHLYVALRLVPGWRDELHGVFCEALSGGCLQLQREGRLDESIQLRKESLLLYPEDGTLFMDLGSVYFKLDNIEEALLYYHRAIQVCPTLFPASRAVQSIYNKEVERWHFRMLNDGGRNEAYYQAILHRMQEGHLSVLDVGTGTGLLSLFAAANGAENIWACESNKFMFKIAQSVLALNNASEKVNLLNMHSTQISIPSDIPKKVSLLVTEVFDAGLLGEGVLPMLIHAWENLLIPVCPSTANKENSVVVPFSATVWAAAVQCIDIARRHRLLPLSCLCNNDRIANFSHDETRVINFGGSKLCKICEAPCDEYVNCKENISYYFSDMSVGHKIHEPYTTEDLETVPFGFEMLSKPYKVLEVNFNNVEELKTYGCKKVEVVPISIESTGSVDAIASWFHLKLDEHGTIISTAPFKESGFHKGVCWHQAIFPSTRPRIVTSGDEVKLAIMAQEDMLTIIDGENDGPVLAVSQHVISFLNNRTWVTALQATAEVLTKKYYNPHSTKHILDLNPFPIVGLEMLKRCDANWKLCAKAETREDKEYIITVAQKNLISVDQIEFVAEERLEVDLKCESFEVICVNVVDPSGELADRVTDLLALLHNKLSSNGVIVPSTLSIEGQLIMSERLIQMSRVVSDKNTLSFKIGEIINQYAVDYHHDVSFEGSDIKPLSSPFEIFTLHLNTLGPNTIFGQHTREFTLLPTEAGSATGVIYWINLCLLPDSQPISSGCHDSHCNKTVLFSSCYVKPGVEVTVKCQFCYGMLDIKIVNT